MSELPPNHLSLSRYSTVQFVLHYHHTGQEENETLYRSTPLLLVNPMVIMTTTAIPTTGRTHDDSGLIRKSRLQRRCNGRCWDTRFLLLLLLFLVVIPTLLSSSTTIFITAASAMKRPSYYEILGVDKSASDKELKKAYRKASLRYHPDKKGGSEEKFKEINAAYDTLSDPQKRQIYDLYGEAGLESGAATGPDASTFGFTPGRGNPFSASGDGRSTFQSFFAGNGGTKFQQRSFNIGGAGGADDGVNIDLSDLLRQMMGVQGMGGGLSSSGPFSQQDHGTTYQQQRQKPKSYKKTLKCTLEDLATGKTKKMKVTFGQKEKVYSIPIKPGWKTGTKVTFNGSARPGGIPTMIFVVEELPHKFLRRDGDDLIYICRISEEQARRGAIKVKVPLPTGETWTHVFPSTNNDRTSSPFSSTPSISDGQRHSEENKGMPIKGGPQRGKLIVEFRIKSASSDGKSTSKSSQKTKG